MSETTKGAWATGWTLFAAFMMALIGIWQMFAGLVGLINKSFYVVTSKYFVQFDATTWGWIHVIVGAVLLITGIGLLYYMTWARVLGVIIVGISALAMFAWLPYYPVWAVLIIVADIVVIWALTVAGGAVKKTEAVM